MCLREVVGKQSCRSCGHLAQNPEGKCFESHSNSVGVAEESPAPRLQRLGCSELCGGCCLRAAAEPLMPIVTAGKVCSGREELLGTCCGDALLALRRGGPRRVGGFAPCFYFVLCF